MAKVLRDADSTQSRKKVFEKHDDGTVSVNWGRFAWKTAFWLWLADVIASAIFAGFSVFELDALGHFIHYGGIKLALMLILAGIASWFVNFWIGVVAIIMAVVFVFVCLMLYAFFSDRVNTPSQSKTKITDNGTAVSQITDAQD